MTTTPKWFYNIKQRCLVQVTKENKRLKLYNGVSLEKAKLILNEYKKGLIK